MANFFVEIDKMPIEQTLLCQLPQKYNKRRANPKYVDSDGNVWFNIKFAVYMWEMCPSIILIIQDVTKSIMFEQQLQKLNQYKDEILASVTHDLRTPLNSINAILVSVY